jgi:hypothetical protein
MPQMPKLPKVPKMPKMPKVEVRLRRIDFIKLETHGKLSFYCSDFWLPILPVSTAYKKTERSDSTILGTAD